MTNWCDVWERNVNTSRAFFRWAFYASEIVWGKRLNTFYNWVQRNKAEPRDWLNKQSRFKQAARFENCVCLSLTYHFHVNLKHQWDSLPNSLSGTFWCATIALWFTQSSGVEWNQPSNRLSVCSGGKKKKSHHGPLWLISFRLLSLDWQLQFCTTQRGNVLSRVRVLPWLSTADHGEDSWGKLGQHFKIQAVGLVAVVNISISSGLQRKLRTLKVCIFGTIFMRICNLQL